MIYVVEYALHGDKDITTVRAETLAVARTKAAALRAEHGDKVATMTITNIENGVWEEA